MICDTPSSHYAFTHHIWNSYLKEYRRYAPDSMQFLETRSEVKFKVTVTKKWYTTLRHPKMHPHIQFGIPTSKNIGDMHRTRSGTDGQCDYYKNHVRGQGQGHIDPKIVRDTPPSKDASRLRGGSPNRGGSIDEKKRKEKRPRTKFGSPTSKNIRDIYRTRSRTDGQCDYNMPPKVLLGA